MKQYFVLFPIIFILGHSLNAQKIDTVFIKRTGAPADSTSYALTRLYTQIGDIIRVTDYFKNGEVQMTGSYKDLDFTIPTGPFYYYDRKKRITQLEVYDPHLHPYIQGYINKSGSLISTDTDSLILFCYYRKNGNVKAIGYGSAFDTRQGTWQHFDKKGRILYITTHENSVLNGEFAFFYSNGTTLTKGNYKDGKKTGEFEHFKDDGSLRKTIYYLDGKRVKVMP